MLRYVLIVWVLLLAGIPVPPVSGGYGITEIALEEQIKAHINDRLYNTCRAVVLTRQSDDLYTGYAVFLNGRRSDLEVVIAGRDIECTFVQRKASPDDREYPGVGHLNQLRARLDEVQALADQQQAQIARLRELCRRAGIDPDSAPPPSAVELAGGTDGSANPPADDGVPASVTAHVALTGAAYSGIRKGMTYRQVAETLGAAGEQISSSYFDGGANTVYVWANPDDSHICVVFRDGVTLVKTQCGLPGIAPVPMPQTGNDAAMHFERFRNWQMAQDREGRIVPLGLSLGDWLERVCKVSTTGTSGEPPQIEIIEEDDQIVVRLEREEGEATGRGVLFYLACRTPDDVRMTSFTGVEVERLCLPSRMTMGDNASDSPTETWRAMSRLAGPPE